MERISVSWLAVFDFEHALIFCGRTQAVSDILNALRKQAEEGCAFVLVLGMSGVGKSSLVRAGVLPTLTRPRVIEGISVWRQAIVRPSDSSDDLFKGLAAALVREKALPEMLAGTTAEELAKHLGETPNAVIPLIKMGLSKVAEEVQRSENLPESPKARLALVVDQMEEIFTLERVTPTERKGFISALSVLSRSGYVWVIVTMRSDFYSRCAELPELLNLKEGEGQYDLRPPTPEEVSQMIRKPARIAGLGFEQDPNTEIGLDDVLRDAAVHDPHALPLLEFTLEELYKRRTNEGILTHKAYKELGAVEGALATRAEEEFTKLDPTAQSALPFVLSFLVRLGDQGSVVRRRALIDEVTPTPETKALVEAFVNARLFITDRSDDGKAVITVAHEALLSRWHRIQDWINENKEFLHARARIAAAEALWQEGGKTTDFLLPEGKFLNKAKELIAKRRKDLSTNEIEFIEASIEEAAKKRTRRIALRISLAAVLLILVGLLLLNRVRDWYASQEEICTGSGHMRQI